MAEKLSFIIISTGSTDRQKPNHTTIAASHFHGSVEEPVRAFFEEADYAPRDGYVLSEREKATGRALRGNSVWKNIRDSVTDRPMPVCGDDQVLLKVGAAGICGTDQHLL